MSYRKIEVQGKVYEYTIGKKFVKFRGDTQPLIKVEDIGIPMEPRWDPKKQCAVTRYVVSPKRIREYIVNGSVRPFEARCEKHDIQYNTLSFDPFSEEIYKKKHIVGSCPECLERSAMDI